MKSSQPLNLLLQCTTKPSQPNGFSSLSWDDGQNWIDMLALKDMKNTRNLSGQMSNKKKKEKGGKGGRKPEFTSSLFGLSTPPFLLRNAPQLHRALCHPLAHWPRITGFPGIVVNTNCQVDKLYHHLAVNPLGALVKVERLTRNVRALPLLVGIPGQRKRKPWG